ncbi:hypothetical protein A0H81_08860 [Grifola frondosa]|uniref:Uncharacterized protein n=1 Tax=Grifola frondosa TaxID=5627 RepID=A0A1C7M341_GRIFR|nr:hypothetical protein A0H81_08860 [Grifola frondosa]
MGNTWSELKNTWPVVVQSFPPKSKFSTDQIPDLTGRVIIVTGGNTGVGKETIKALLEHNAKVYMASRSKNKADAAIAELKTLTGKEAIFLELDLSSLASVRKAANEFLSKEKELHVLFNNAGVMWPPMDMLTVDGYDLQFGTNVLGHFFFTELLIPALIAGKETSPDHHARVITTSSSGAYMYTINWDTFRDGPARRKLSSQQLYYQSKFANVVVAREVAKRYADQGIISMSCHPGNLQTDLQRYVPAVVRAVLNIMLYPAHMGALTQLWAGTMPETLNYTGKFLIPWARVGECRPEAYDPLGNLVSFHPRHTLVSSGAVMYTTASVFFKTLAEAGITHAFVNWGNDHPALLEELERQRVESGGKTVLEIVTCPHEMVALSAAQGYAQVTGNPAAVIVHVDVGTQGLAGAVHNVDRGQVPVLIFSGASAHTSYGELKGSRNEWPMWLQDIPDQPAIVRQYMRFTSQIQSGKNVAKTVMRALQIATSQPKGPVYLWARRDVTEEDVDQSVIQTKQDISKWPAVLASGLSPLAVETITSALLEAKFPLIITANAGRNPRAVPLLAELSTLLAVAVFTSCPSSVCIPSNHPYFVGSSFGGKNEYIDQADVLIVLDVDIPWIDSKGNKPRSDARVFVIDTDPLKTTFGWSHVDAEMLCRADSAVALGQIIAAVRKADAHAPDSTKPLTSDMVKERGQHLAAVHSTFVDALDAAEESVAPDGKTPSVPFVLATLRDAQLPTRVEPHATRVSREHDPVRRIEFGVVSRCGCGRIPGREVARKEYDLLAAIVGDGVFLFGVPSTAYWMARRYNTPFLTVILNNGGWFSPKSSMLGVYPDGLGSKVSGQQLTVGLGPDMPDYAQIAVAAGGAWGRRVERADELQSVLEEAVRVVIQEKRCAVVDCMIESI